jgi:hypothetical protein
MTMVNTNVGARLARLCRAQVNIRTKKSVGWFACKQWPYLNLAKQS